MLKMQIRILTLLAVLLVRSAATEIDGNIKKGSFPYMAVIYYPDDSVVEKNGIRVTRAGVLVKPDWIITSSLETDEVPLAFPKKTLVARMGSIIIDNNFTFNEDEEEQESEIIQIIRPYNFSVIEWWSSDISLLKTLIPFNKTSSVGITAISHKPEFTEKECFILVYAKKVSKNTKDRYLMQIPVEIVPPPFHNCGNHFKNNTMICAQDIDDKKNTSYDSNFCHGNGGGPLICESDIYGLQTYSNGCKEPYLYHVFSGWARFITCGIQDICQENHCDDVCTVINKDTEKSTPKGSHIVSTDTSTVETSTTVQIKFNEGDDNISGEEGSPERPTATIMKEEETTTAVETTPSILVENTLDTLVTSKISTNIIEENRRSNVEAQQHPIKKSSASILTPYTFEIPIFVWVKIHFV